MLQLVNDDCMQWLDQQIEERKLYTAVFADPPDNLGLSYDGYKDQMPAQQYFNWLELLLSKMCKVSQVVWLSYYHKHDLGVKRIVRALLCNDRLAWEYKQVLWVYTFGQYTDSDLSNGYRPILRLTGPGAKLNMDAIREPSARMVTGDKRAAGPRVPSDVWDFSRVVGNAKERRPWHPTQHPEALMERIVKMSCCSVQDVFVDLFVGSGTTLRVAKRLGQAAIGIEQSPKYCQEIRKELSC